ncbi:hypothetical protein MPER_01104, partial [Moniliophthora perniciosa FA553]
MYARKTLILDKIEFEIRKILVFPRGLITRGTWVLQARSKAPKFDGKKLVLKFSSPAVTRTAENEIVHSARAKASGEYAWVLNHLPHILQHGEFVADDSFAKLFKDENFEKRVFRYIVAEELSPITNLTNPLQLAKAFKDIILCHQWLVLHAKVMHRDVSVNNLM